MTNTTAGWALVGTAVAERIDALGYTRNQVVDALKMDWRTLEKIVDGGGVKRRDRALALIRFLGWRDDAFERIRRGEPPVEAETSTTRPGESDLRDLLGVGGQVVQDELDAIKARLDRIEGLTAGDVVDLDARRPAEGWARAAKTDDNTPAEAAPTIRPTKRPRPPDEGPDPTEFHD